MLPPSPNQFYDRNLLFEKAQLQPAMRIADFGCGAMGHVVFPAAAVVGSHGVVYAVDILKDTLKRISEQAKLNGLHAIHTVWSDLEKVGATAIPEKSVDVIFIVDLLVHLNSHDTVLTEAERLLKEKGRIVVVDWSEGGNVLGPAIDRLVDFDALEQWALQHGFVVQERFPAGKWHAGVVFYRHD